MLYVDPRGPYPKLVEHWYDEARDARTYAGPWPVVAHPPCGPWGRLFRFCTRQSAELGPVAVEQVRRYGGVLEHPAHSRLWKHCSMAAPGELPDAWGGYTIPLNQVDWGHVAQKATWVYVVGVERKFRQWPLPGKPRSVISTSRKTSGPPLPECSAQQRRRTPVAFAEWLIALAGTVRR